MTSASRHPCVLPKNSSILAIINMNAIKFDLDPNHTLNSSDFLPNTSLLCVGSQAPPPFTDTIAFYCYATPILIVIGMLGNALSLKVFTSKRMRKLEASVYLSALSLSDLAALLFYVLVDWIRRGVPSLGIHSINHASLFEIQGLCQAQMYLSYVTRFLSAWIIVLFTIERYVAVCHPLRRRGLIFGHRSSYKILCALLVTSFVLMVYKPLLTGRFEYRIQNRVIGTCSRNPSHPILSFVLDSVFAMSITLLPFLIITVLNTLIILRLYNRHRRIRSHVLTEESIVRMEFTVIFLVISFVFIALNLPFFCFWGNRFLRSFYNTRVNDEHWERASSGLYLITRFVFYLNYAINFFLYSISGACFRKELRVMFLLRRSRKDYQNCTRLSSHSPPQNSVAHLPQKHTAADVHVHRHSWV